MTRAILPSGEVVTGKKLDEAILNHYSTIHGVHQPDRKQQRFPNL
jgi:hypothetical protein